MRRFWQVARVVVAVVLVGLVLDRVDPGLALDRLRAAPRWIFLVPATLLGINGGVHALRLLLLLPAPRPPFLLVLRAVLVGNFFGLFLPTGAGDAAKIVALGRDSGDYAGATAALATSRLLELVPWGLLCLWGAVGPLPRLLPRYVPLAALTAVAFTAIVLGVFVVVILRDRLPSIPILDHPRLVSLRTFRPSADRLAACLAAAFLFAAINCLAVWAVLNAYGVPLSYGVVLGVIPTLDVLIAVPVTVSGVGVREWVFVHGLAGLGVDAPTALAVVFTRWTGDLFRSAVGGLLWSVGRVRSPPP